MTTYYVVDSLTTTHGEAGLPTSIAQCGGLQELGARGRSLGLWSSDLSDQAYSWRQEASYSLRLVSLGRTTVRLALAKPPSMSRERDGEELGPPGLCDPDVGFSQAPEHVEGGGGLWYAEGGGSARLIAEDCLQYFLFNLKKRNTKGKIHSLKRN
jgi:hypothetical protein